MRHKPILLSSYIFHNFQQIVHFLAVQSNRYKMCNSLNMRQIKITAYLPPLSSRVKSFSLSIPSSRLLLTVFNYGRLVILSSTVSQMKAIRESPCWIFCGIVNILSHFPRGLRSIWPWTRRTNVGSDFSAWLEVRLHLMPRSKNAWSYTSTTYAFMARCSVKNTETTLPLPFLLLFSFR